MFTLSDASTDTKKIFVILAAIIGGLILLLVFINLALIIKNAIFPSPAAKPAVAFGKLQPQNFPGNVTTTVLSYTINTLSGSLPSFPSQANVYRIEQLKPNLLAINNFQDKITRVDFASGYTAISDKIFEWKSNTYSGGFQKIIRTNIVDGSFTITSPYTLDKDILAGKNLPNQTAAIELAQAMLTSMDMLPTDIDISKNKAVLLFINGGSLSPASSMSNTQVIEVNFFQKDVNNLPIFYEKPNSSNIRMLVTGGMGQGQIVSANYIHQAVSEEASTYPLKTTAQAFEELKQGKAYIATYLGGLQNINITNVTLGYYIGSQPQDFLIPIFVFAGDNGFSAYVPAVTDEWINK